MAKAIVAVLAGNTCQFFMVDLPCLTKERTEKADALPEDVPRRMARSSVATTARCVGLVRTLLERRVFFFG